MKPIQVSSRYYVLKSGFKTQVLLENQKVYFKSSHILDDWVDIYLGENQYGGTITLRDLKENFKVDNLLLGKSVNKK